MKRCFIISSLCLLCWSCLISAAYADDIDDLIQKGYSAVNASNFDGAKSNLEKAYRLAKARGNKYKMGVACSILGTVNDRLGNSEKAIDYYLKAVAIHRELKDTRSEGNDLENISIIYYNSKDFQKALVYNEQALAVVADNNFLNDKGDIFFSLGLNCQNKGNYDTAIQYYQKAVEIHKRVKNAKGEKNDVFNIAVAYRDGQQWASALESFEKLLSLYRERADLAGENNTLVEIGIILCRLEQYNNSLAAFEKARGIAKKIKNETKEAEILANIGLVNHLMGNDDKVMNYYSQALNILMRLNDRKNEANVQQNIAIFYQDIGRYAKAIETAKQLIVTYRQLENREKEGGVLFDIGAYSVQISHYAEALQYYQQALAIKRSLGDSVGEGKCLAGIGQTYQRLGQNDKALEYVEKALKLHEAANDKAAQGDDLYIFVETYFVMGRYAAALDPCQKGLSFAKESGNRRLEVALSCMLATLYRSLGQYEQALQCCHQALDLAQARKNRKEIAEVLGAIGTVHLEAGRNIRAMDYYQQALPTLRELEDWKSLGFVLRSMGTSQYQLEHHARALEFYTQALAAYAKLGDQEGRCGIYLKMSFSEISLGQLEQARRSCLQALRLASDGGMRELLWGAQFAFSLIAAKAGSPDAAIFFGKKAINILQTMRQELAGVNPVLEKTFLEPRGIVYRHVANLLIDQGRLPEAQQVLAMLKEEEYYDFVRRAATVDDLKMDSVAFSPAEKEADAKYAQLRNTLVSLGSEATALEKKEGTRTESEKARLQALRASLDAAQAHFQDVLVEIEEGFRQQGMERYGELQKKWLDTDLRNTVRELGQGTTLVHYLILPESLRILVTTPDVILTYKVGITAKDLRHLVAKFQTVLQNPNGNPEPIAEKLYAVLIAPIEGDLETARTRIIMVYLDGVLRYIPLAALKNEKGYLVQRYAVDVFTAASVRPAGNMASKHWKAAGFGVSLAHPPLFQRPLKAVPEELEGIIRKDTVSKNGVLPGIIHLDKAFTFDALRDALGKKYPVVHIASHFLLHSADPTASFLLLGDDSHLTLAELLKKNLLFDGVDLLTLSACDTAVGQGDGNGREMESLGVMAQNKGAHAVLASLWAVNDASTGAFMKEFYRLHEEEHLTKAEALRRAQLLFIEGKITPQAARPDRGTVLHDAERASSAKTSAERYHVPYYWAPFILMGNGV